ncbi:hypothetical protein [Alsobacter sp. SYSU BS001988]
MTLAPRSRLSLLVVARVLGGAAGALPPVYAITFLDRASYGAAAADVAAAMLLCGPLGQFINQGYMRDALAAGRAGHSGPPAGAFLVHLFATLVVVAMAMAAGAGVLAAPDACLVGGMSLFYLASRIQESHLIAAGRQLGAVVLVFILPPTLTCLFMAALQLSGMEDHFSVVAIGQLLAALVSVAAGAIRDPAYLGRLKFPRAPRSRDEWRSEGSAIVVFITHGAFLSAAEQVPVIALRLLGHSGVIPGFELARKIASVPGVIVHALFMQTVPRMIDAAHDCDWAALKAIIRRYTVRLATLGLVYALGAAAALALLQRFGIAANTLPLGLAAPLLAAAVIGATAAPFGGASLALRGEKWWVVGGGLGLAVECAVAFGATAVAGPNAVAWAVLGQIVILHAVIVTGTIADLARLHGAQRFSPGAEAVEP